MEEYRAEVNPEPEYQTKKPDTLRRFLIDLLETLLLALILFLAINAVSARIRVESVSMQPTLNAGDFVFVNKLAYRLGKPSRGDVIIFRYPPDPQREPYIKRLIGLPGDKISVSNGVVFVNGDPLVEPYISAPPNYNGEWIIPSDSLYVLGDNRNSSSDSHRWGMVPRDNVIGKAILIYWPPIDWKMLTGVTALAAQP